MKFRASIFIVLFLLVSAPSAHALNPVFQFVSDVWHFFADPKKYLEPEWVFQPRCKFDPSIAYKEKWNRVELTYEDETLKLADRAVHNLGAYVGIGPLSVGYSIQLGQKDKLGYSVSFDWISNCYGAQFHLTRITGDLVSPVQTPTDVGLFTVEGYYAFNRRRFAYNAAHRGGVDQRRTAGSPIIITKLLFGDYLMSNITEYPGFKASQIILGAGYSLNWVLFHKDAASTYDLKDLRNLTLNFTAIPTIPVMNLLNVTKHTSRGNENVLLNSLAQPGLTTRFAVSYTFGRFYICATAEYQINRFLSLGRSVYSNLDSGSGTFEIHYRF